MDIEYRSQQQQDFEESGGLANDRGATTADVLQNMIFAASGKEPRIGCFANCCEICGTNWRSWRQDFLCSKKCREIYHRHE
jgi:hypothetical protein